MKGKCSAPAPTASRAGVTQSRQCQQAAHQECTQAAIKQWSRHSEQVLKLQNTWSGPRHLQKLCMRCVLPRWG